MSVIFQSQCWNNEKAENAMDVVESVVKSLRSLANERRDRYVEATFVFILVSYFVLHSVLIYPALLFLCK